MSIRFYIEDSVHGDKISGCDTLSGCRETMCYRVRDHLKSVTLKDKNLVICVYPNQSIPDYFNESLDTIQRFYRKVRIHIEDGMLVFNPLPESHFISYIILLLRNNKKAIKNEEDIIKSVASGKDTFLYHFLCKWSDINYGTFTKKNEANGPETFIRSSTEQLSRNITHSKILQLVNFYDMMPKPSASNLILRDLNYGGFSIPGYTLWYRGLYDLVSQTVKLKKEREG